MDLLESPKEKTGGLAFDVILKPASVANVPLLKGSPSCKGISQEIIDRKLREADERRMACESQKLALIMKDKERAQEANQRIAEMSDSFSREAEKKLTEKMELTQENKTTQIKALLDKLKEHAVRVEEVRRMGEQYRLELKERIDRKLETAEEKRERYINLIQDRLRKHKEHIDKVIEAGYKFSKDTEEKLISKMETTLKNREDYLSNLLQRLKDHDRRIDEVRKNKLNQSSSEESMENANDSCTMESLSFDISGISCEGD